MEMGILWFKCHLRFDKEYGQVLSEIRVVLRLMPRFEHSSSLSRGTLILGLFFGGDL